MPSPDEFWRHMRAIMYQPTEVWLATENSGDRWLTDQFVLLCITDSEDFGELPDGPYKLTVSKGPEPRDAVPEPDIEGWFAAVASREWHPAVPTEWSVAEHPGKAMLWAAEDQPALLGESTWTALKRYYPDCYIEHSFRGNSLFRFRHEAEPGLYIPFAYAAGIRIPEGQEVAAKAIVAAVQ